MYQHGSIIVNYWEFDRPAESETDLSELLDQAVAERVRQLRSYNHG